MLLDHLTQEEWKKIADESHEIGFLIKKVSEWNPVIPTKDAVVKEEENVQEGLIKLPSGIFTTEQLTCMLNTLPFDITFVDKDDFDMMKERYIGELQNLREELQVQEQNQRILEKKANRYMDMVNHMKKYLDKREYNEALVQELVEYIEVYADGSIHVCFKCKDEFQQIAEEMEGVQIG